MPDSGQGWAGRESLGSWAERVAQLGSWYWTPATGAILWSENLFHLFGLDPDAVTPTTELVLEMTHPEDREHVERTIAKATREGVLAPL